MSSAVIQSEEKNDETAGREAADVAEALDEQDLRSVAGRSDGGGKPGGTATNDQNVDG